MQFVRRVMLHNGDLIDMAEDGEYPFDLLYWALQNPEIDNHTRDEVLRLRASSELPMPDVHRAEIEKSISKQAAKQKVDADKDQSPSNPIIIKQLKAAADLEQYDESVCINHSIYGPYHVCTSDHFQVRWYDSANDPSVPSITEDDIIPPESIHLAFATVAYLEAAREAYLNHFGKVPLAPQFQYLIVSFQDLGSSFGSAGYSDTYYETHNIRFNSVKWLENPSIIPMVTAHELFHHIQYAFGYKDDPGNDIAPWFVEGSASWAEIFMHNHVRNEAKMNILKNPGEDITALSYAGAEFWSFFDNHLNKMKNSMEHYDANDIIEEAIDLTLAEVFEPNNVFLGFDNYLTLHRRDRIMHSFYPDDLLNEYEQEISPNHVDKVYFRGFKPSLFTSTLVSISDLEENGAAYVALHVNPAFKDIDKQMRFVFQKDFIYSLPFDPTVKHQYQFIYAKCNVPYESCGLTPQSGGGPSIKVDNIPTSHYSFVRATYPFFADLEYETTISLDANSLDWDLIFIPIGVDKAQSYIEVKAYIEDL